MNSYLSAIQSGSHAGRSTTDIVWTHRWLSAACDRCRTYLEVLGIDMSKAFDTIYRDRLLEVISAFLKEDHIRLIRYLLVANTSLSIKIGSTVSDQFSINIGTPQGDSLSLSCLSYALKQPYEISGRQHHRDQWRIPCCLPRLCMLMTLTLPATLCSGYMNMRHAQHPH